jgi:hypothetical protein
LWICICGYAGKYGYIDKQGKFVISPQFDNARRFEEGLAAVRVGGGDDGKWGFIDKQGKIAINPQFYEIWLGSFKEGLAAVRIGDYKTGKRGLVDKQGKFVINPQFDEGHVFSGGLAVVRVGDEWGFITIAR